MLTRIVKNHLGKKYVTRRSVFFSFLLFYKFTHSEYNVVFIIIIANVYTANFIYNTETQVPRKRYHTAVAVLTVSSISTGNEVSNRLYTTVVTLVMPLRCVSYKCINEMEKIIIIIIIIINTKKTTVSDILIRTYNSMYLRICGNDMVTVFKTRVKK